MIVGVVNSHLEATLLLALKDASGKHNTFEAIIDTGFNGSLTLPPTVVAKLGLPWRTRSSILLANGSHDEVDVYAAIVDWDGAPRRILVEAADTEPLLGMQLLRRHALQIEVVKRGNVAIELMR